MKTSFKSVKNGYTQKPGFWSQIARFIRENEWSIVAVAAIVAIVLGIIGLTGYLEGRKLGLLDIIYYLMQLFVFEAGLDTGKQIPLSLSIAHLLAPTVFGYAAVKALGMVFRNQFQLLLMRFYKQHTIICGLGHKGLQLVQEYRALGERVIIIETDNENKEIATCRELGAVVLIGNAADLIVLDKAKFCSCRCLFAVTGDEGANVEIAVRAYERITYNTKKLKSIIKCFVNIDDIRLAELVQQQPLFLDPHDAIEVRLLKVNKIAARQLFTEYPLDYRPILRESPLTVHLLIVGFGHMGENVALQAAGIGHFANQKKLKITVVDRDANLKEALFLRAYPHFRQVADILFVDIDFESTPFFATLHQLITDTNTLLTIAVCINNNTKALSCALSIAPYTRGSTIPIHIRLDTNSGLASLLHTNKSASGPDRNLNAFGMLTSSCKPDVIEERTLDLLARIIHDDFVTNSKAQGNTISGNPSMLPWEQLAGPLRDAVRQQADHIPVKLRAVGCQIVPFDQNTGSVPFVNFTKEEIKNLSIVENARMKAERLLSSRRSEPDSKNVTSRTNFENWIDLPLNEKMCDTQKIENIPALLKMAEMLISRENSFGS